MAKVITAVDMFCGAGGTSTGLAIACREAGLPVKLLAINHWTIAIETHTAAHPWADHMCASLDHVRPVEAVPSGRLHLLVASPECTHHARARGGRPMNDQSRATAWHVAKWAQELYIDNILIENVKEFLEWGPLGANGKPLKSRKGETFKAFVAVLESLGYRVEWRILNAADYGDPTTRERLFIQARRGRKAITWPKPTHSPKGESNLFGTTQRYRTARQVIDWKLKNPSIFTRKKALAPTTISRIIAGLKKFDPHLEPFVVTLRQHVAARSVDEPIGRAQSVDTTLPTITTKNGLAFVEPFIVAFDQQSCGDSAVRSADEPLSTVTTKARHAVAEPFITKYYGTAKATSVDEPLDTVTTKDRFGLVMPVVDGQALDIRFRMLQPHELARAQGFPDGYKFQGNKSQIVKQIGNAVPVNLAKSLCSSLIAEYSLSAGGEPRG